MANTVSNVSAGKPKVGGAIYRAELGSTLPTDASSVLDTSVFECLGYISDDGIVNSDSRDSENIKAWGGDIVLNVLTSREDTFKFTLLEILNADVLATVYGSDNVTGTLLTGITITANSSCDEEACYVIDMVLRNDVLKRIVIPDAKVTSVGDISYVDNDATGYETTLGCMPDEEGNTHYEYIEQG